MDQEQQQRAKIAAELEALDPGLADGFRLLYSRDCPVELRMQESPDGPQAVGNLEVVRCRILAKGDGGRYSDVRVELSSESDLFFLYSHNVDIGFYQDMQERQKLMVSLDGYPAVLSKMFNSCIKEPQSFVAVFVMQKDGRARLDFVQNMEYKFVELLSTDFVQSPEQTIRRMADFRYNALKSRLSLLQARLQDVYAVLKTKNPSLLLHLEKNCRAVPEFFG